MSERDCEHGHLRRSCEICETDERIAQLESKLNQARDCVEISDNRWRAAESALTTARIDGARAFVASVSSDLMSSDARVAWLEIVLDRWLASESKEG